MSLSILPLKSRQLLASPATSAPAASRSTAALVRKTRMVPPGKRCGILLRGSSASVRWRGRYDCEKDRYLLPLIRYIHENPVNGTSSAVDPKPAASGDGN